MGCTCIEETLYVMIPSSMFHHFINEMGRHPEQCARRMQIHPQAERGSEKTWNSLPSLHKLLNPTNPAAQKERTWKQAQANLKSQHKQWLVRLATPHYLHFFIVYKSCQMVLLSTLLMFTHLKRPQVANVKLSPSQKHVWKLDWRVRNDEWKQHFELTNWRSTLICHRLVSQSALRPQNCGLLLPPGWITGGMVKRENLAFGYL